MQCMFLMESIFKIFKIFKNGQIGGCTLTARQSATIISWLAAISDGLLIAITVIGDNSFFA